MPSLNGFSCGIYTHEGRLAEYAQDEIPGGLSCYIPAKSGQQFWLSYKIERPIRAKAMSIDFWVDGNRIDTQFPLASAGSDLPSVGPVASTINSQYSKDEEGVSYRREVFFTLNEQAKQWSFLPGKGLEQDGTKMGTIECKVFRAEKTGVWEGTISPDTRPVLNLRKTVRGKGISHRARLGASMPAEKTTRYTFRNLDPCDAPFAYFKFYYRSYKFLQANHIIYPYNDMARPISPESVYRLPAAAKVPRSLSTKLSRHHSVSNGLKKQRSQSVPALSVDLGTPFPFHADPKTRPDTPVSYGIQRKPSQSVVDLQTAIANLEAEFIDARNKHDNSDILQNCYEKLRRLKRVAEKLSHKEEQGRCYSEPIVEKPKEEELTLATPKAELSPPTPSSTQGKTDKGKGKVKT